MSALSGEINILTYKFSLALLEAAVLLFAVIIRWPRKRLEATREGQTEKNRKQLRQPSWLSKNSWCYKTGLKLFSVNSDISNYLHNILLVKLSHYGFNGLTYSANGPLTSYHLPTGAQVRVRVKLLISHNVRAKGLEFFLVWCTRCQKYVVVVLA